MFSLRRYANPTPFHVPRPSPLPLHGETSFKFESLSHIVDLAVLFWTAFELPLSYFIISPRHDKNFWQNNLSGYLLSVGSVSINPRPRHT